MTNVYTVTVSVDVYADSEAEAKEKVANACAIGQRAQSDISECCIEDCVEWQH